MALFRLPYRPRLLKAVSCGLARMCLGTSAQQPTMPPCDFQPDPYQGPSYEDTLKIKKKNLSPALFTYYTEPILIHQGYMQWLFDHNGRRYLDMFGGIVTVSVGHCHPKVVERTKKQLDKLWHTTNIYLQPAIHEYANQLVSKLPGDLKVVYFTNSGSEANDMAIMMAKLHTRYHDIVGLRNCYHGASPYIMDVTSLGNWKFPLPRSLGSHATINPDVYRGPWGGANCRDSIAQTQRTCSCTEDQCEAATMYANQLEDLLLYSCHKKIAGFIAEPIQGVGGTVQLPKGYLKRAYELVRQRGGLCIADEVQTGFGRLGSHYWGFEAQGVVPDIVTMAKGIGNGFPLGAVVTTPEIAKTMTEALHFNTYGGNPLACVTGSAVMEVIEQEQMQKNSSEVGNVFLQELLKLRDDYEVLGDVRGKGLMLGIELVKDKESKAPLPAQDVIEIWDNIKDRGVLLGRGGIYGTVLRIKPPMCVTIDDAKFTCDVIRAALKDYYSSRN